MVNRFKSTSSTDTVSTIAITPPKKLLMLSKEQFGNSGLPGSEYVTQSTKMYPKYNLARLAVMGLLGAGAGAGVGNNFKGKGKNKKGRYTGRGAIIGGIAGAASSLIYDTINKQDEPTVVGAAVAPDGKGSIIVVGSSKLFNQRASTLAVSQPSFIHAPPSIPILIMSGAYTKYPGWAGAIMAHGMYVQRCMMSYIYDHAHGDCPMHVEPNWGYSACTSGAWTLKAYNYVAVHGDESATGIEGALPPVEVTNNDLWTERFAEWPSPIFKDFNVAFGTSCTSSLNSLVKYLYKTFAFPKYTDQQGFKYTFGGGPSGVTYKDSANAVNSAQKFLANAAVTTNDPWWTNSAEKISVYQSRYKLMVSRSRWFVWAAEMFRIHADMSMSDCPSGWRSHCNLWGIGCASDDRRASRSVMTESPATSYFGVWQKDENGEPLFASDYPVRVNLSKSVVKEYLESVMKYTPTLFAVDSDVQLNVNPEGMSRVFMDLPDPDLGSILPPISLYAMEPNWYQLLVDQYHGDMYDRHKWHRACVQILLAVVSTVMSYASAGASTLVSGVISLCMTFLRLATSGFQISRSEIIGMVGMALNTIGNAVQDEVDIDLSGGLEQVLKKAESLLADVSGFHGEVMSLLSRLDSLKTNLDWGYSNELLATVNDMESVIDKANMRDKLGDLGVDLGNTTAYL